MRLAAIWILAGCYDPTISPGAPCQVGADCPADQACVANICGGTQPDAAIDARIPDGVTVMSVVVGDARDEVRDTEIWGDNPGINYGADDHFSVDATETGLLWFDLTQIEPSRTVVSATLRVTVADEADEAGGTVTVHRLREGWVENEATWLARADTQAWSVSGARPPSRDAAQVAAIQPAKVETSYGVALPLPLVQEWVANPTSNFGLALVRGSSAEHVHIHTRESNKWSRLELVLY